MFHDRNPETINTVPNFSILFFILLLYI
jgi:hypothetical protein